MSDRLAIQSKIRPYSLDFVDDFTVFLKRELDSGAFLILDSKVSDLFKTRFTPWLQPDSSLLFEALEHYKTIDKCKDVIERLVSRGFRKTQKLVAVGGGILQDVTAFTASILYRGIDWVFFPTTLLAQADSCIGGKTSINLGDKKNLVGNFYPPSQIYSDISFLDSLEEKDIKSGIGEMMHYFIYSGSASLRKMIDRYQDIMRNRSGLKEFIWESLSIKKAVIEVDEFDKNERNKFNYGHTFGHALETLTHYEISHGQAVTIGMDLANYVSLVAGLMSRQTFEDLHVLLSWNFPEFHWDRHIPETYFEALQRDKKNVDQDLVCILAERPGQLIKKKIPLDSAFKQIVQDYFHLDFSRPG